MLKQLYTLIILTTLSKANAQELSIGYLGNNLWNPGISIEYDLSVGELTHSAELSFFSDPGSHKAAFLLYGIKLQVKKWDFDLEPLGIYRSFLSNTYTVDDAGNISKPSNLKGNFYYSPSLSIKRKIGTSAYLKTQFLFLFPYNYYVLPVVNFGLGYRFTSKENEK